ncbi:GRN-like protein [Mya arenaria]|uniref:GRN-like protein n=1 Tax=Mya arenaria TaxID=6604 RepID=A0ABY7DFT9_MYAAR|nr:GRN-like protein [Mya arenaria]
MNHNSVCLIEGTGAWRYAHKNQEALKQEGFGFKTPPQYYIHPKVTVGETCPDNRSSCAFGSTCCRISISSYGCCNLPMASCCSDMKHCCPKGLKCDPLRQACISEDTIQPWADQNLVNKGVKQEIKSVMCPDGEHQCQDGQTCCKSAEGYSCCPLPKAVCCSDEIHCCPENTKCDLHHSKCVHQSTGETLDWFQKTRGHKQDMTSPLQEVTSTQEVMSLSSIQCDNKHACPTGNTCCKMEEGKWGCCPKPDAVCCDDKKHCCPHGTKCDSQGQKCIDKTSTYEWHKITSTIQTLQLNTSVKCDMNTCAPEQTCCSKDGIVRLGCCPIPNAVCCSTTCDVKEGKCLRGNTVLDWFVKTSATELKGVKCDSTHECPTGNTCCKLSSGQYGCCPIPNAVCCSDQVHCCPSGTTCDVKEGKCLRGNTVLDWFVKTPATELEGVKCDSTHECPTGNTCCKTSDGQWGCCPIPNAVCCSDGVHCCPSGTTCDVKEGKCLRGNTILDWFVKTPATELEGVKCDSTHECPTGNTCCKTSNGQWGCCPIPNAVCCSDQVHCCPSGTTCDVKEGKCLRGNTVLDWFVKLPATELEGVKCDSTHECPTGNTCCKTSGGQWGCCPIPNAVCCSDQVHCCPSGTTCDVKEGKCLRGNTVLDWFVKTPATELEGVKCDSTHECPTGNTCCKTSDGQWGCCPIPNAVCCSDGVHCCPSGTTCDVKEGKCLRGNTVLDWIVKTPATELKGVKCDSTHECPTGNTCCKTSGGQWGCCPIPNAVCCSDQVHCCPSGTTCDVKEGKCLRGNTVLDWFVKTSATELKGVKCDSTHECPTGNTCCKLSSGQYGCCPIPNAVCCSDQVHCCPSGTTCDVKEGKCLRGNTVLDWFVKTPATELEGVKCDSTHECPTGNTCCKTSDGQWGCCPIPNAVCCSDGVHCCPSGTTCDVKEGKCLRGNTILDWFVKTPATELEGVKCDSTHECPTGNTCCKTSDGQWGCCPIPNAVCCSDQVHCCPSGTTCDVKEGKCLRGNTVLDWFVKTPATELEGVKCDSTHECPTGNTCCKTSDGQWGCCPIPNAVCCSDGVHCCPSGTTCDVKEGKCLRGNTVLGWIVKTPATELKGVKCDSTHECPTGNTCCKTSGGQWGCCPIPNAVCCSDQVHCCPSGTTCDVKEGKCLRGNTVLDWFVKTSATELKGVKCDSTHECPTGNTCCKLSSGQYGCCPIPNAVCCSDQVHCCPSGTTCDVKEGKCLRGNTVLDWFVKTPATELEGVKCDSTHECPTGNTCCKTSDGQWGCCPIPNADCCSDGVHCCPSGTTCDVKEGKCLRGNTILDWFVKTPATELEGVKCDSTHECPTGNTCCKTSDGQWGCCPIPNAVCCSDQVHCCPSGTTCDVKEGKCLRGNTVLDWFVKLPATELEGVKCDSTHECPTGNTCCKTSGGQWGCCPIPNAVCCSDQVHCCPSGTTCDVKEGKCLRGNTVHDWFVKTPATELEGVKCDSTHECPTGNTCCKTSDGQWGCCPIPNAVCCSDQVHCCPSGTTCDVKEGKCLRGNTIFDWFVKTPATELEGVKCDSTHECPTGNTCCKTSDGQWGCCPIPNAVCCSDQVHCCPSGTTCDVKEGKCLRGNTVLDWFVKTPATELEGVRCDSTHECPTGNTCCKTSDGQWGCCPIPNAVCCSDQVHCCPSGTTCDVKEGKCLRGNTILDWFEKSPAKQYVKDVICPDGSECQDGQTCCEMSNSDSYGCCPLPDAVCCSDGQHCCPIGYKCDLSAQRCTRGIFQFPWLRTRKLKSKEKAGEEKKNSLLHHNNVQSAIDNELIDTKAMDVKCGDGSTCPDQYTCCSNGKGGFNCCPMPEGVCCADNVHCCPHGYVCAEQPGTCRVPGSTKGVSGFLGRLGSLKGIPHS